MLSFEEWLKLSVAERGNRYKDLSNKDKFKVRQGFYFFEPIENDNKDFEPEIPDFLKHLENTNEDSTQK